MPTKLISKALLGTLSAALLAAPAFAGGNCGTGNCASSVQVMPSYAPEFGPMTIRNENPMGHLRSVNFQRSPNVSIMRVHSMGPTANLTDAPNGFTGGCNPVSTSYCRQSAGVPVQVSSPIPTVQLPAQPRTVRVGGGYDASKFAPRTYGDASLVPGIAYLPTSKVVRDPAAAQQVLDTGRAVPQPLVTSGGIAPNMGMIAQSAPQMQTQFVSGPSFGQPSLPLLQQSGPMAGSYGSSVAADGTYWEKVSGPTSFGSTVATSVICKRQLPTRVVNPIIGVPVAVPVPVQAQQGCQTTNNAPAMASRYGQNASGRWTY